MHISKLSRISIIIYLSTILFVIFTFFSVLSVYFGSNPLNSTNSNKSKWLSLFPQGWAFFTGSSKEQRYYVFDSNLKMKELRSFSSEYYYGVSRHNRVLNVEINNIFQTIMFDSIKGFKCKLVQLKDIKQVVSKNKMCYSEIKIDKKLSSNFKGKYFFVTQMMLPWTLLHRKEDYPSNYTIYAVNINPK